MAVLVASMLTVTLPGHLPFPTLTTLISPFVSPALTSVVLLLLLLPLPLLLILLSPLLRGTLSSVGSTLHYGSSVPNYEAAQFPLSTCFVSDV